MPEFPRRGDGSRRIAWVTTEAGWRSGWNRIRDRVELAGLEVDLLRIGRDEPALPSLGALAFPFRPLTAARLVGRLGDGGYALVHLLDDEACRLGLPAARFAGCPVVVASAGGSPLDYLPAPATGRLHALMQRFRPHAADATLLIAMGQQSAAAHAEARRLDPLRWVLLEEGLGEPDLVEAGPLRRRGGSPVRVMVDGDAAPLVAAGVEAESVSALEHAAALRKARYADLWITMESGGEARIRALAAAQAGAAIVAPASPSWDWVRRCNGGALVATENVAAAAAEMVATPEMLYAAGGRAAAYVARHFESGAITARLLAWYDDLLALGSGTSGPATLDLSALGAGALEGRAKRDLLTGLRES